MMDPYKCNFLDGSRTGTVEDITNRLDQMDFNQADATLQTNLSAVRHFQPELPNSNFGRPSNNNTSFANYHNQQQQQQDSSMDFSDCQQSNYCPNSVLSPINPQYQPQENRRSGSSILIATNVDSSVFCDKQVQSKFEALFTAYDPNVAFRYLKSFRRVRLDFTDSHLAELARSNLAQYKLGATEFKCYSAQIIKPSAIQANERAHLDQELLVNSTYLNIPKLTKQFLISPPASPPVGWEPVTESSPCIDVQLISALANLVPGTVHEIHQGTESQPGIYVEVCEEPQFDTSRLQKNCPRIPKTPNPGFC